MRVSFELTRKRIAILALAAVAAPFAVGASGIVPISASSGHWAPFGWFLHWVMGQTVDRQSLGYSPPDGFDPADPKLVQRVAGHFATGCAPCHGAPGEAQSPVVLAMTPHPPRLEDQVGEWKDRELFWIGKHGVKYSGMPAWATQKRDDEVWALVAFLRAYPAMTPEDYGRLALGDGLVPPTDIGPGGQGGTQGVGAPGRADVAEAVADCARCHGYDGRGVGEGPAAGAFPVIAGQSEAYLFETLQAYSIAARESGIMQPAAKRYDVPMLRELARWYANQPVDAPAGETVVAAADPPPTGIPQQIWPQTSPSASDAPPFAPAVAEDGGAVDGGDPALLALGRGIAERGIPSRKIASCQSCHGPAGRAQNGVYPYLSGQPAWYLEEHLHLWQEEKRGGTRYSHLMHEFAINLTEEQMKAVSAWYASRPLGE